MSPTKNTTESSLDSAQYTQIAREILLLEAKELQNTAQKCAHITWTPIVESIIKATDKGGKLIVCGVGKSGHIGSKIAATLASTGTPSFFLHPTEALHGDLGMIGENDIILAISYSGESSVMLLASRGGKTKELLPIVDICKKKGVTIITVTENLESPLAQQADIVLKQHVNRETDKYNCQGTTSGL